MAGSKRWPSDHDGTRKKKRKTRGNLKKTTAKGAYAKTAKKAFGKRRRPFVETKTREEITVHMANRNPALGNAFDPSYPNNLEYVSLPVDDAFTSIPPKSFTRMCQGIGEDKMIGESVYSRYIKSKVSFRFPGGNDQIAHGNNMYLVHGWVTVPVALTNQSGETWGGYTVPTQGEFSMGDLNKYIGYHVKQYMNEREDTMRFIPKQTTNIKFLGYRKVRTDRNAVTSMLPGNEESTPGAGVSGGVLPDIQMSCTWKVNRKIHYVRGKDTALETPGYAEHPDTENWYPNFAWIPFMVIYNPDFAKQLKLDGSPAVVQVCHNNQHWYTDS